MAEDAGIERLAPRQAGVEPRQHRDRAAHRLVSERAAAARAHAAREANGAPLAHRSRATARRRLEPKGVAMGVRIDAHVAELARVTGARPLWQALAHLGVGGAHAAQALGAAPSDQVSGRLERARLTVTAATVGALRGRTALVGGLPCEQRALIAGA